MRFTKEEFDMMVRELLFRTPASYDMLCRIAEKELKTRIDGWCNSDLDLRGGQYGDDVMQLVHIRLIERTVPFFLLRDGIEGDYNNDPEGFAAWMITVAKNLKRDYASRVRSDIFHTVSDDDKKKKKDEVEEEDDALAVPPDYAERDKKLARAFDIVLSSDLSIYKKLTWFALAVIMVRNDISKIKATHHLVGIFENKTLADMYAALLNASEEISWMTVTYEQHKKILNALQAETKNGIPFGETAYKEFFMQYQGEACGLKSVSDWTNRINYILYREIEGKAPPKKKSKKKPLKNEDDKVSANNTEDKQEVGKAADGFSSGESDDEKRSGKNETFSC